MNGFVSKSVNPDEFHRVTKLTLPRAQEFQIREHQVMEKPQSTLPVDLNEALEGVDGDVDLLRDVVAMFSQEYLEQVNALRETLAGQDASGVERTAHKLKKFLGNVGGLAARDLAQRIETMGEENNLDGGAVVLEELEVEIERVVTFFSEPGRASRIPATDFRD